jgi:hypothetical protein
MAILDTTIKAAKPLPDKPYKLSDEKGIQERCFSVRDWSTQRKIVERIYTSVQAQGHHQNK